STGTRLYDLTGLRAANNNRPFNFDTDYGRFAAEGIYITNMVRCQANFGGASREDTIKRVKDGFQRLDRDNLIAELTAIQQAYGNTPVLLAAGKAYKRVLGEIVEWLTLNRVPWL